MLQIIRNFLINIKDRSEINNAKAVVDSNTVIDLDQMMDHVVGKMNTFLQSEKYANRVNNLLKYDISHNYHFFHHVTNIFYL